MIRRPPRSTRTDTPFPTRRSSDLEGRHEMRPGPCAGGSCAPGGRPAAGMDDVDAMLGYRAGQPVDVAPHDQGVLGVRSEEHTSELQSLMRISYAVFCLKNKQHKSN